MAGRPCSKQLMKVLTTPSKVANVLDWRKSTGGAIATLDVHADRIGIAISQHPSCSLSSSSSSSSSSPSPPATRSYSLPIRQKGLRKIPDASRQQLSELVTEHKVCGFVVSWPVQRDTGLMGASCGRTLFAIEELLRQPITIMEPESQQQEQQQQQQQTPQHSSVFTPNRPICLWDGVHPEQPKTDAFGRSSAYSRTCDKAEHLASEEQYHQDESIVASTVWDDFVQTNWPELYRQQQQQQQHDRLQETTDGVDNDEWDHTASSSSSEHRQTMMAA